MNIKRGADRKALQKNMRSALAPPTQIQGLLNL